MKMFLAFVALMAATSGGVTIKGHRLGESPAEFLAADAHVRSELAECHADEPHQITEDQVKAMSRKQQVALAESLPGWESPKKVEKMAAEGKLWTPDKRYPAQKTWCEAAVSVLEQGKNGSLRDSPDFGNEAIHYTSFYFEGKSLALINVDLSGNDYDVALKDFSEKSETSPTVLHPAKQNAMGTQWSDNIATWTAESWVATLHEGRNPANPSLSFTLETKALWNRQTEEYEHRKSGLDP